MEETGENILDLDFTDLLLGFGVYYIKSGHPRRDVRTAPPQLCNELDYLYQDLGRREKKDFHYCYQGESFRAARMETVSGTWFILRRSRSRVLSLLQLGFPPVIRQKLLDPKIIRAGLVVFAGRTGAGKTTSASGFIKDRLDEIGGHAVTIEDPPELPLHGEYEKGVCFQREMHYKHFFEGIIDAMRYGSPDMIFLGELRESHAVNEALRAAVNGHLIVATLHAPNIQASLQRMFMLAQSKGLSGAAPLLAEGFSGIVHQSFNSGDGEEPLNLEILLASEKDIGIRSKIREGKFHQLSTDVQQQMNSFFLDL